MYENTSAHSANALHIRLVQALLLVADNQLDLYNLSWLFFRSALFRIFNTTFTLFRTLPLAVLGLSSALADIIETCTIFAIVLFFLPTSSRSMCHIIYISGSQYRISYYGFLRTFDPKKTQ